MKPDRSILLCGLVVCFGLKFFGAAEPVAMAQEKNDNTRGGELLGSSPSASEIYNPANGDVLLLPGVPLFPPPPRPDVVPMGLIDSGVIAEHPQLKGLVIAQKDFAGNDPVDRIGHGTIVALQFLKPLAELMKDSPEKPASTPTAIVSAKVTAANGQISTDSVIQAIHWVISKGAKIVNMSLGFRGSYTEFEDLCETIQSYSTQPNGGVLFIVAAGNFGPDVQMFPAACGASNVLAVAEARDGKIVASSGRGDIAAEGQVLLLPKWAYYLEEGARLARQGDFDAAERSLNRSIQETENPEALFQLGLVNLRQDDLEVAYGFFERAQRTDPTETSFRTYLGVVRLLQHRLGEAETQFVSALELDPGNSMARFNLGRLMLETGRFSEALKAFERVRAEAPEYPNIDESIAVTRQSVGE